MGLPSDEVVIIRQPEREGEPSMITINCPDKTGLGCDLCRIILFFGLSIVQGGMEGSDFSQTQGRGTKRDRRIWTNDEENALLDGFEELVARGMKADNGFKCGYMNMLERWFEEKFPGFGIKGNPHIESKMKNLKKNVQSNI